MTSRTLRPNVECVWQGRNTPSLWPFHPLFAFLTLLGPCSQPTEDTCPGTIPCASEKVVCLALLLYVFRHGSEWHGLRRWFFPRDARPRLRPRDNCSLRSLPPWLQRRNWWTFASLEGSLARHFRHFGVIVSHRKWRHNLMCYSVNPLNASDCLGRTRDRSLSLSASIFHPNII